MTRLTCLSLALFAASCSSLEFRDVHIAQREFDESTQAYRVTLQFELYDGQGLPVQAEDQPLFQVYEDDVPSTSESVHKIDQSRIYRRVVLLLDTSASVGDGLEDLRGAAESLSATLVEEGFERPAVYRFARTVQPVEELATVEAAYLESPDQRWTSLYYALREVITRHPDDVLVVFSDGADNYSQNFGVTGVDEIVELIEAEDLEVHAIGCGNVKEEQDRNGVSGVRALKKISRNGTYEYVEGPESLADVFEHLGDRVRNVFSLEYYSPNLWGEHELVLHAKRGRSKGRSEPLTFATGERETEPAREQAPAEEAADQE